MNPIYLDYNASTPVAPSVARIMLSVLDADYGNPSSAHWAGRAARERLQSARDEVAALLGCAPDEIVFTSGGSEANNLAIKGMYFARAGRPAHIITTATEHPSVLKPCAFLEGLGARITRLPVDATGRVDPDDLRRAIAADTILISVMHANNEVGTIGPLQACAAIAHEHGIPIHTDGAQSVGKLPARVDELDVDMLSIAGHKLYAPKGVGALYVRRGTRIESLIHGAGHEGGRRAGTESVLLGAALGAACALAMDLAWTVRARGLRDRLFESLQQGLDGRVCLNGHPEERLPNTLNMSFIGQNGAELLAAVGDIAASVGSACHSGLTEISPVLQAMGVTQEIGMGAVRFSLGRETTRDEIDETVTRILRSIAP